MKMAKKYKPFATDSQYEDWSSRNCGTCRSGYERKTYKFRCPGEHKLCLAFLHDGQITEDVARAIGYLDSEGCDLWECPGWARR